ncbi:MAG: hypothetical protein QXQ57_00925 [Sulfolobales archaeon]
MGGSVELSTIYEAASRAYKARTCCEGYKFYSENGNIYSKDVEYDIEALESLKMIEIIKTNNTETLKLTQKGYEIAKSIENLLDRKEAKAISSVIKGDRRNKSGHNLKVFLKSIFRHPT